jgi:acetyl-CoA C-acetyltransferase
MPSSPRTPVLVGVGQVSQRFEDPEEGAEPLAMMVDALARAGEDAEAPTLLERAEAIYVVRGIWRYGDPGREVARRLGAGAVETVGTPFGGNFAQACVNDAARAIQAGRRDVVLVTGGENGRSSALARRQGLRLPFTECPGEPDRMLAEEKPMAHAAELARGIKRAVDVYPVFETAIRHARGETVEEHASRIARLWAGFNHVAQGNPHAWIRKPYTAEEIGRAGSDNPMIGFPYPRLMNSNNRVDMGAGLIVCSLEAARAAGVPEAKLVYLHAGTEANDAMTPSQRDELHRSPAIRIAGGRALELAGVEVASLAHVDVYSCFPSAVQVAARELGLSEERPLTVTGGLTFGGGPLNDYVLHSIARMAEVLREGPGGVGLVTANGGLLAKHAFGVYATEPPRAGFQFANTQPEVDALGEREAVVDWDGPVTLEAYTVMHERGEPQRGFVACRTPEGGRTWATVEEASVLEAMMREEFCGRPGRIDGRGNLDVH